MPAGWGSAGGSESGTPKDVCSKGTLAGEARHGSQGCERDESLLAQDRKQASFEWENQCRKKEWKHGPGLLLARACVCMRVRMHARMDVLQQDLKQEVRDKRKDQCNENKKMQFKTDGSLLE
eukprot:1145730-Pelagomonas_calceolata.AAC.2